MTRWLPHPDKVSLFAQTECVSILDNCIGACFFVYSPRGAFPVDKMVALVRAATGWDTTLYELLKGAERVLNMARAFNMREGLRRADDTLPERFFQPLEGGRLQGHSINRQDFQNALTWYYQIRGWDIQTGIPTRGKLAELDLDWIAAELGVA